MGQLDKLECPIANLTCELEKYPKYISHTVRTAHRSQVVDQHGGVYLGPVANAWARYKEYTEGREPLAGMAYASFTYATEVLAKREADAAKKFSISGNVLDTLSRLSCGKGERKYPSQGGHTLHRKKNGFPQPFACSSGVSGSTRLVGR